jgi:hypothetical protein
MTTHSHTQVGWTDRLGALSGAAYVVLICIGNSWAAAGEKSHPTGAQVLDQTNRMADRLSAQVGLGLELLGFVAFAFFVAWLHGHLRRAGADWLAGVWAVGGVMTLAIKVGSAGPMVVLFAERKSLDPELARILNLLNGASFVITFMSVGIMMLGAGLAGLASGALGRPTSWIAVVLGLAGCVLPILTRMDPYGTNPLPFLLSLLWILVTSVRLAITLRAPDHVQELVAA